MVFTLSTIAVKCPNIYQENIPHIITQPSPPPPPPEELPIDAIHDGSISYYLYYVLVLLFRLIRQSNVFPILYCSIFAIISEF